MREQLPNIADAMVIDWKTFLYVICGAVILCAFTALGWHSSGGDDE